MIYACSWSQEFLAMSSKSLTILLVFLWGRQVLLVLYTTKRSILKSLPMLGIFLFLLCQFCSTYFEVLELGLFQFWILGIIHLPGVLNFVYVGNVSLFACFAMLQGMQDLSSLPDQGSWDASPAVEVRSLNHGTVRVFPRNGSLYPQ